MYRWDTPRCQLISHFPLSPGWFDNVVRYRVKFSSRFCYHKGNTLVLKENILMREIGNPSVAFLISLVSKKINAACSPLDWVKSCWSCVWHWLFQPSIQGLENDWMFAGVHQQTQAVVLKLAWATISWAWMKEKSPATASIYSTATAKCK